jgi:hypothetical protein
MRVRVCAVVGGSMLLLCLVLSAGAEQMREPAQPPPSLLPWRPLVRKSGYIFSGTVTKVKPSPARAGDGVSTVYVTFHVDHGILGVRTGKMLVIREWAGVWQSGEKYRVGERVVLFLHPFSKLGLTSIVGGPQGRLQIGKGGGVMIRPPLLPIAISHRVQEPAASPEISFQDFGRFVRGIPRGRP